MLASGLELPALHSPIPGPRGSALAEQLSRVECPALTARRARRAERTGASHDPISWVEAKGACVVDADGNRYVDLTGGFGASAIAHGHAPIVQALKAQADRLIHALGDVHPSDVKVDLLARLAALAPWPARVILGLSGADAVEAALKTAVLYTKKPGVVAFEGGYHGLSHGPLSACGYGEAFREPFAAQLNAHVAFAPYPHQADACDKALAGLDRAIDALSDRAGALLIEPIQGRGGVNLPSQGFLQAACERARKRGLVVIVDEIYTGLGRAGHLFEHVHQGADADLVCLGKALGGGMPVSACLGKEHVMAAWGDPAGEAIHTSTFLGNPLASATALAFLDEFANLDLPTKMNERGAAFRSALARLSGRHNLTVRGAGLMLGINVGTPERVLSAMRGLLEHGYIVLPAGAPPSVLCLTPPACISDAQIAGFCGALDAVLSGAA